MNQLKNRIRPSFNVQALNKIYKAIQMDMEKQAEQYFVHILFRDKDIR